MKPILQIIIFSFLILSCSSTKKIVTTPIKEVIENKVDTIVNNHIIKKDSICVEPISTPLEISKIPEDESESYLRPFNSSEKLSHSVFNQLLEENISNNGSVNYKGFIKSRSIFKEYLKMLETNLPQDNWTHNDKLAYWMNVYNAFTIKLIIDNYPTASIKDIKDAWDSRFFKLGKKWYNLNEVEHKILRKMGDARIHFGINCASFSCPPILNKAFTAANVNDELDFLAKRFINDTQRNKISSDRIELSKIFQWFGKDFKTEGSLIDFLNKYSEVKINSNAKKTYLKYNWDLNE